MQEYFKQYLTKYTPYKEKWNYEDGCVLIGCIYLYKATKDKFYKDFVLNYLAPRVQADGIIPFFDVESYNIDSINCGKALFFAFDETKDEKYEKALTFVMGRLSTHPRCKCTNFWHKTIYPNQIWLDGLYMAQPFYLEYSKRFNNYENLDDIILQFKNVQTLMFNQEKQLYYHGYDESRLQPWCDKETGCSKNFWLRSMGWFVMAIVDCYDVVKQDNQVAATFFATLLKSTLDGLLKYIDTDSNLFYQVIDHSEEEKNYLETSGSAMVAYSIIKGCLIDALDKKTYLPIGQKIVESLENTKLVKNKDVFEIIDICAVAGLGPGDKRDGSVKYYLSEPKASDDAKGVGPVMMAYAKYLESQK